MFGFIVLGLGLKQCCFHHAGRALRRGQLHDFADSPLFTCAGMLCFPLAFAAE
jgi:hypothetical protein